MTEHKRDRPRNGDLHAKKQAPTWTFFRQWLKNPLSMAAVSPSSRELAQKMLRELPHGAKRVIELGGGTGVFTQALIDQGVQADDMFVLELNEALHQHLKQRFPKARVVCGDARDLKSHVLRSGYADGGAADAVISGLGLLSMPKTTQREILDAAFSLMTPAGRFVQFTYGPTNPVSREVMRELDLVSHRASFTLWNVPPASVYVVSRSRSKRVAPARAAR
ncbi:MAG TPA: methyltransferase domain-containing protein [Candidatus Saccharimonadia bacterium]|nr:methyltransferase domain-containing protein [Candidatus Saccharimonadia bacterium]